VENVYTTLWQIYSGLYFIEDMTEIFWFLFTVSVCSWYCIPTYSASQKSSSLLQRFFCNIFTLPKSVAMKFCPFVGNLYLHTYTDFGSFISIY